ncbi:hypothetical protein [Actinacidiphila glaucinigra]|uniref:hypothetical protein n=1 Tax=Actinacidiphila glaucinigra TaxID=235986 RepID=UPI003D90E8D9
MTLIDAEPTRGTGRCGRCRHHTNDGIIHMIETGSGPGGRVLVCANVELCRQRARRRP